MLKESKVGNFSIVKEVIPQGEIFPMYNYEIGRHYPFQLPYNLDTVELRENDIIWMNDGPDEQDAIVPALKVAKGDCLECGLGIGLLPTFLTMNKNPIRSMDIVELNEDVVKLVFPQLKLAFPATVIYGDAKEYLQNTEKKYDFIHVDIWPDILVNIKQVEEFMDLAQRCLKPNGTIRVWLQELYFNIKNRLSKVPVKSSGYGIYDPCLICGEIFRDDYAGLCMDCACSIGVLVKSGCERIMGMDVEERNKISG